MDTETKHEEIAFLRRIEIIRKKAENAKTLLNGDDLRLLKKSNPSLFYERILFICKNLILFADRSTIIKLRTLNIPLTLTRWLIPLEDILNELNPLSKKRFLIRKNAVIKTVILYLGSKITTELEKKAGSILKLHKDTKPDLKQIIVNYYRRNQYATKRSFNIHDTFNNLSTEKIIGLNEKLKINKKSKQFFLNLIKGKTESFYLKKLPNCYTPTRPMSQTLFLSFLAPFFRVICKDRRIWTKAEFENRPSSYENDYNRYLAIRIRKITRYNTA